MDIIKRTNVDGYEKLVLIVGILALAAGALMINGTLMHYNYELSWGFLQTTFIWLIMVVFLILLAANEDMKISLIESERRQMESLIGEVKKISKKLDKKK